MTLDNQTASILVGQEVPVTTGEALSQNFDNQFRTVQRPDVGIQLEVKPQINAGGAIKLFLRQAVSRIDRTRGVSGKSVSVRVDPGGRRILKHKKKTQS